MHLAATDRRTADAATALMLSHGDAAAGEAATRAEASRSRGNLVKFCHWRQVGRLLGLLATPEVSGTVH